MDRRSFLQNGVGLLAGVAIDSQVVTPVREEVLDPEIINVFQGPTNHNKSLITVVSHKKFDPVFMVNGQNNPHLSVRKNEFSYSEYIVYNLLVENLVIDTVYVLEVISSNGRTLEKKTFKALDWRSPARMAFLSCSDQRQLSSSEDICNRLSKARPDVIFHFGDLVYANTALDTVLGRAAKPKDAFRRYVHALQTFPIYSDEKLTPIFAIWDDHDTGRNDANSSHPYLAEMGKIFRSFYPMEAWPMLHLGPGMSYTMRAFGAQFIFFDQRSFATHETMLGGELMDWTKDRILGDTSPLVLVGPQQFGNYHSFGTSLEKNATAEWEFLLKTVKTSRRPTVFMSGDMHYSQIQTIDPSNVGFATYEITSSAFFSMSAGSFGKRPVSEGQLEYYGYPNFIMIDELTGSPKNLSLKVRCVSENSDTQFSRRLDITVN
jgi:alkaline phosphatase D